LRTSAKARRAELHARLGGEAPQAALDILLAKPDLARLLTPGKVVSAYWPMASEFDTRPLLASFQNRGMVCALPVVISMGQPLAFRRFVPGEILLDAVFKTRVPPPQSGDVTPDLVFVPLLAVDRAGYRLGYGAGYYDRTLHQLRERGSITAVGLAYEGQIVDHVPHDAQDEPLDWLVTEAGATRFAAVDAA
jgi:5-formyltetrahydrofolate cyclo-ligase